MQHACAMAGCCPHLPTQLHLVLAPTTYPEWPSRTCASVTHKLHNRHVPHLATFHTWPCHPSTPRCGHTWQPTRPLWPSRTRASFIPATSHTCGVARAPTHTSHSVGTGSVLSFQQAAQREQPVHSGCSQSAPVAPPAPLHCASRPTGSFRAATTLQTRPSRMPKPHTALSPAAQSAALQTRWNAAGNV
eukprot:364513-Chlamydomonas_euryale.AAC.15